MKLTFNWRYIMTDYFTALLNNQLRDTIYDYHGNTISFIPS